MTGSVSVASLHQLARERAAARHTAPPRVRGQGGRRESLTEGSVAVGDELMVCGREVEGRGKKADGDLTETYPMGITEGEGEGLPPLTHTAKSAVSVAVHRRLPAWITQPRLVNRDIESGSGPLSSVLLPAVITSNLKTMGYTSLFPIQVGCQCTSYMLAVICRFADKCDSRGTLSVWSSSSRCVCVCSHRLWEDTLLCSSHGYSIAELCCPSGVWYT